MRTFPTTNQPRNESEALPMACSMKRVPRGQAITLVFLAIPAPCNAPSRLTAPQVPGHRRLYTIVDRQGKPVKSAVWILLHLILLRCNLGHTEWRKIKGGAKVGFRTKISLTIVGVLSLFLFFLVWVAWTLSGSGRTARTFIEVIKIPSAEALELAKRSSNTHFPKFCDSASHKNECRYWEIVRLEAREDDAFFVIASHPSSFLFWNLHLSDLHLAAEDALFDLLDGNIKSVRRTYRWLQ